MKLNAASAGLELTPAKNCNKDFPVSAVLRKVLSQHARGSEQPVKCVSPNITCTEGLQVSLFGGFQGLGFRAQGLGTNLLGLSRE